MGKLGVVAVGLFVLSSYAIANDSEFNVGPSMPTLVKGADSLMRLQTAQQAVFQEPTVREFLQDTMNSLMITQRVSEPEVETTKFQHYFKGLQVLGSMTFHHMGNDGVDVRNEMARFDLDTQPGISNEDALAVAKAVVGNDRELSAVPELKILPSAEQDSARLIYWVKMAPTADKGGRSLIIDAHSGKMLSDIPHHITIAPITVYSTRTASGAPAEKKPPFGGLFGGVTQKCQVLDMTGAPVALNLKACSKVVANGVATRDADDSAKQALSNASAALSYYFDIHKRNSFDNKGTEATNVVHVGFKFDNAFWSSDEKIMAYGDGDGQETGDFTKAVDVAGHEMTHGVISETADLIYEDESGALNEAYADFFGKMIANDGDWAMGRKLFLDPKNKGFRDLKNPANLTVRLPNGAGGYIVKKYPSKVSERFPKDEYCDGSNDNCWVHINSTIPGHASYKVVQAIGKAKAERLYYVTLTQYLKATSNFASAAKSTMEACKKLYDAPTCAKVRTAFVSVGML